VSTPPAVQVFRDRVAEYSRSLLVGGELVRRRSPCLPRFFRTTAPTRGISAGFCVCLCGIAELANGRQRGKMPVILGGFVPHGLRDYSAVDPVVAGSSPVALADDLR